jgi:hypothetical protein
LPTQPTTSTPSVPNETVFGDSLTAGGQDSSVPWPKALATLQGDTVNNQGISGQASGNIASRMGAVPTYVTKAATIPISGSVNLVFTRSYEPAYRSNHSIHFPSGVLGTVAGVTGYLADNGSHVYVFTPTVYPDSPVAVAANTQWFPVLGNYLNGCVNIEAGRDNYSFDQALSDIAAMVATAKAATTCWSVFTILNGEEEWSGTTEYDQIIAFNNTLKSLYGSHVIDFRSMLVAAYNPANPVDVIDHTHDVPPFSLRANTFIGTLDAITDTVSCNITATGIVPVAGVVLTVNSELIYISGGTNGAFTCTRGYAGTTPATHNRTAYAGADNLHPGSSAINPSCVNGPACIAAEVSTWLDSTAAQ